MIIKNRKFYSFFLCILILLLSVAGCGGEGSGDSGGDNKQVNGSDSIAPTTPANLQATAVSSSQIDISWDASTDNVGVAGYRIYRDSSSAPITDVSAPTITYTDTGLQQETTYSYTVSAYDLSDNEGNKSNPAQAATLEQQIISSGAPVILYTDVLSGPNTGGENNNGIYLSIFGKNFGSDLSKVKVYIGGGEVADYKYLGASNGRADIQQLSIQPGGSATTGAIKVVVDGVESNTDHTFTVRGGDIYFVSHSGSDSSGIIGDINNPFRTIQTTIDRSDFGPGDTIVIRGDGIDWDDKPSTVAELQIIKSGTSGNPLMILGYPGESVNIPQKQDYNTIRVTGTLSYITVAGIKITWRSDTATYKKLNMNFMSGGLKNNIRVVNNDLTNSQTSLMSSLHIDAFDSKILGNHIHHYGSTQYGKNNNHGIYISDGSHDFEIAYNHLEYGTNNRGIQLRITASTGYNISIHHNLFNDLPRGAIAIGEGAGPNYRIYNNIFYRCSLSDRPQGAVYISPNAPDGSETFIYNNIFYDIHNTSAILESSTYDVSVEAKNNTFYLFSGQSYTNSDDITGSNNLFYNVDTGESVPSWSINSVYAEPKFIDHLNFDFHLQSGSPAIDAGNSDLYYSIETDYDGNPRPMDGDEDGTAEYDIGAYEYEN